MAEEKSIAFRDMLDIIFADRNKNYGAYAIRREYSRYLMRATLFGILFIAFLLLLPKILGGVTDLLERAKPVEVEAVMGPPPDLSSEPPPPPPPPPPTPPPPARTTQAFVPPVVKKDEEVVEEEPKKTIEELEKSDDAIGTKDVKGDDDAEPTFENPKEFEAVEAAPVEDTKEYQTFDIQKLPAFPGGDAELQKFLRDNIKYPAIARENNIQGTVALSFVVQKNGSITDVSILKDPGGGCGKEAVRVLQSMPNWEPGEANGNKVKVRFTLPVRFRLE